mgnify:CR=1 FL=1
MRNLIKRISALLLCLLLVLSLPVTALAEEAKDTDEAAAAEEGTTLRILRQKQFLDFAENCRLDSYSRNLSVVLLTDIDLTGVDFAGIPIFCGNFDGNGHTVSGLSITQDGSNMGLFRYVDASALIQNLTVSGEIIPDGSRSAVGGIAGTQTGYLYKCENFAQVYGRKEVGGIVGQMEPTTFIEYTEDTMQILQSQLGNVSNLTGQAFSTIQDGNSDMGVQVDDLYNSLVDAKDALDTLLPNGDDPYPPDRDTIDAAINNANSSLAAAMMVIVKSITKK